MFFSQSIFSRFALALLFLSFWGVSCTPSQAQLTDAQRLEVLKTYANHVLETGRDHWSGQNSPLLADGVHVDTGEPVVWKFEGDSYIISNMASQQNLFRFLTGLSNITGDPVYKQAAVDAIQYHFDHLLSPSGLLLWGGHQFIDLRTLEPANTPNGFDTYSHEFKDHYPFYDLMYEVDPEKTTQFLRALWNAHVTDWGVLDMNRHGSWDKPMGELWDNKFNNPEPFFESRGLTFINAGSDLIYAASKLYEFEQEEGALEWARNLNGLYLNARHPETGLGAYQYSKPERRRQPPAEGPLLNTQSVYGDRAENQFGPFYGDVAREGWVLWGWRVKTIYVANGFMQMSMAESMGEEGKPFLDGVVSGLKALAHYGYDAQANHFRAMWADGTDLTGIEYPRIGYYSEHASSWDPLPADMDFLMVYARAYRLTGDPELWQTVRQIASGLGLGEFGDEPGSDIVINMKTPGQGYKEIFALLELYRLIPDEQFLNRARQTADQMIKNEMVNGYFVASANHVHARFDSPQPLAILALDAVIKGKPELVPDYIGGTGYIHGRFDGLGRVFDNEAIWSVTR